MKTNVYLNSQTLQWVKYIPVPPEVGSMATILPHGGENTMPQVGNGHTLQYAIKPDLKHQPKTPADIPTLPV